MKKIFAILISLLFVASVFGVASIMALDPVPSCTCPHSTISQASVQVGDTFTVTRKVGCTYNITSTPGTPAETIVQVSSGTSDGFETVTIKALRSGTVTFTNHDTACSTDVSTIRITAKEYPFASFMKILGFGKKD